LEKREGEEELVLSIRIKIFRVEEGFGEETVMVKINPAYPFGVGALRKDLNDPNKLVVVDVVVVDSAEEAFAVLQKYAAPYPDDPFSFEAVKNGTLKTPSGTDVGCGIVTFR
jgi:hypothetical protein